MLIAEYILVFHSASLLAKTFQSDVPPPQRQLYLTMRMADAQLEGNKLALSLVDSIQEEADDDDDF